MTSDLILRARLSMLRSNLDEVRETPSAIAGLTKDVQALLLLPQKEARLATALRELHRLARAAEQASLEGHHKNVAEYVEAIATGLKHEITELEAIVEGPVRDIDRRSLKVRKELGGRVEDLLARYAENELKILKEIEDKLELARSSEEAVNGTADAAQRAPAVRREAWESYRQITLESKQAFLEYVDLLGGLALRDAGFDRGICRLADTVLRLAGRDEVNWSLTIPAREEAFNVTLARVVRVGFPEWTIWALPLAAQDFGQLIVARPDGGLNQLLEEQAASVPAQDQLRICLADAWATLIMGPAYACAALLLRLDPATAFAPDDQSLTARRVQTILRALKRANDNYAATADQLGAAWTEALAQADAAGALDPAVEVQIDELIAWVDQRIGTGRKLAPRAWERIVVLARDLREGRSSETELSTDDVDARYVLNAAWHCRLGLAESNGTLIDRIGDDAFALWERIEKTAEEEGGPSSTSPREARPGFGGGAPK